MTDEVRKFPAEQVRVESGPIQFGDDWPGIFMRGDYAHPMSFYLGLAIEELKKNPDMDAFTLMYLEGLQKTLASCLVS